MEPIGLAEAPWSWNSSSSWGPHTPSGLGPSSPELGFNLTFCLRGPKVGDEEAEPVRKILESLEGPAMLVSEVKLIQVPSVLTTWRAPHPAVIALQLLLTLPFLTGLFSSLHLGGKGG